MPVIVQNCPLCGNPDSKAFDQRNFRGQNVINRMCSGCGLVYQSPRMSQDELDSFYAQEYRQLYQGSEGPSPKDLAVQTARAQSLLAFMKPNIRAFSRHLDIGCSAGLLLHQLQAAYDCQSVGIEPGTAYRQYAQGNGLKVYETIEALRQTGEAPFDLISLVHVLEHLPDPVSYLSGLRQHLLAENGWLLVEVPNLYGHDCFEIAHPVSYSPHTLAQTLLQAGFEVQRQEMHGRPRSQSIPLYITTLSTTVNQEELGARSQPPVPEHGVRRKRQVAMLRRKLSTKIAPRRAWLSPSLPSKQ